MSGTPPKSRRPLSRPMRELAPPARIKAATWRRRFTIVPQFYDRFCGLASPASMDEARPQNPRTFQMNWNLQLRKGSRINEAWGERSRCDRGFRAGRYG